ncbi:PAS domain-containing protein [Demequina lignilytica]|uniref:PAS domain-containing protein n=1 Tax=Demequina lignilytica TaxID=3051663 RepID=A0AB35MEA9_9MICO|nr:PAS domain-containing protein [Demequina sp. SYSU T0a273]MDN4482099.1 PAS domain-containing protein [Demequina sp. SYSU T0a273]
MARPVGAEPTGEVRAYPAGQVFFSTTDRRGVITSVNSTFVRLSRFGEGELLGAPHNIIRHPSMPGAAFHIMWERILAGRPMVAYVRNLARDGAEYLTFSTVTPLRDGFISVRSAVMRPDLFEPVDAAYRETRELEARWRAEGASRADAAARGAADLAARLRALGFDSYDDVLRAALPAEVDARRAVAPPAAPTTEPGSPWSSVVSGLVGVDHELEALRDRYDVAVGLASELTAARDDLQRTLALLQGSTDAAAEAAASVADAAPVLVSTARAVATLARGVGEDLTPLGAALDDQRALLLDLRASLALSVLHTDMALIFAGEALSGEAYGDPVTSIADLAQTVADSVVASDQLRTGSAEGLRRIADAIDAAHGRLLEFQRMMANWRNLVVRSGVSGRLAGVLGPVDDALRGVLGQMQGLTALAAACREQAVPAPTDRLLAHAAAVGEGVRAL